MEESFVLDFLPVRQACLILLYLRKESYGQDKRMKRKRQAENILERIFYLLLLSFSISGTTSIPSFAIGLYKRDLSFLSEETKLYLLSSDVSK